MGSQSREILHMMWFYLSNERHHVPKLFGLFVWIRTENAEGALVMIPLLKKFLFVSLGVSFD